MFINLGLKEKVELGKKRLLCNDEASGEQGEFVEYTYIANIYSGMFFIIAIICVIIYATANIEHKKVTTTNAKSTSPSQSSTVDGTTTPQVTKVPNLTTKKTESTKK